MRSTIGRPSVALPRLALPPPAARGASTVAPSARRPYRRYAGAFGAMVAIALVLAVLGRLLAPAFPDMLPLWLVVAAASGSVLVGTSVNRLEGRPRPAPQRRPSAPAGEWSAVGRRGAPSVRRCVPRC